jgi:hypothetical protein
VESSGKITWKIPNDPNGKSVKHADIHQTAARELLERFRVDAFWSACGDYTRNVTDSGSDSLEVRLGERTKKIGEYAESAPELIHTLEIGVDAAADTHRWRVGDPTTESIADIGNDAWLPKPGRTDLMQAAYEGKVERIVALLDAGASLTDVDSSGWSPLMYAAGAFTGSGQDVLLRRGADLKYKGPRGETVLHFSALTGNWDKELVAAGAQVNAQTDEGVTPLMVLAQGGDAKEIDTALLDGADARLKDSKGRTAMDYLEAANCGRPIIHSVVPEWMTHGYSMCNALQDDYESASTALSRGGAWTTQVWRPVEIPMAANPTTSSPGSTDKPQN